MLTRKSGILALVLGATILGSAACEKKTVVNVPPNTQPTTVTIAPNPVPTIKQGQTVQLVAVVANNTNQAVTWSILSGSDAITLNTSTGLVTGKKAGVATVQAVSQADGTAKDAVSITVTDTATTTPTQPTPTPQVTIGAITQTGTIIPVNPGNVFGTIDVITNVDLPAGSNGTLSVDIVNPTTGAVIAAGNVCTQTFTAAAGDITAASVPVTVVCSVNTAALDANGVAMIVNGTYRIKSTVTAGGKTGTATSQTLVFNNQDMLVMTLRTDSMCPTINGTVSCGAVRTDNEGLSWRAGNVIVDVRPAIYSTTQAAPLGSITSMQVSLSSSGPGFDANGNGTINGTENGSWIGGCGTVNAPVPGCAVTTSTVTASTVAGQTNLFRARFPATTAIGAGGAGNIEDTNINIAPTNVITQSGNTFPVVPGVTFIVNYPVATPGTLPVPVNAQQPLRLDNLAPRITNFELRGPATAGGASPCPVPVGDPLPTNCYANGGLTFAQGSIAASNITGISPQSAGAVPFTTVDFGVDKQTTTFAVGSVAQFGAGTFTNNVTNLGAIAPALSETTVSGACPAGAANCIPGYAARATVVDQLGNDTIMFASATGATGTLTAAGAVTFGYDVTAPTITSISVVGAKTYCSLGTPCTVARRVVDQDNIANTVTVTFRDTAATANAAPAGFTSAALGTPDVKVFNKANPAGTAAAITANPCGGAGTVTSTCSYTVADAGAGNPDGYIQITTTASDATIGINGPNTSAADVAFYLDDETAPTMGGVTAPSTIVATQTQNFTADMSDNVELGDLLATLGYGVGGGNFQGYYAHTPRQDVSNGGYGLPVTTGTPVGTVTYAANTFIYTLETSGTAAGALAPATPPVLANAVNFALRDMAGQVLRTACAAPGLGTDGTITQTDSLANGSLDGSCLERENNNIQPNILFGNNPITSYTASHTGTSAFAAPGALEVWSIDSTRNTVTPAASNATPTGGTITIRAQAVGAQGTFPNPFDFVNFYAFDNVLQRWVLVGSTNAGAGVPQATTLASDADVVNARVWRYTLNLAAATQWPIENACTNAVPAAPCMQSITGTQVLAIGVRGGRGLRTPGTAVTGTPLP